MDGNDHAIACERRCLGYLRLAELSLARRQLPLAARFLLLATPAAAAAGWLPLAERARAIVVRWQPRHLVGRHASMADALRHEEFAPLLAALERDHPWERSEHVLANLDPAWDTRPGVEEQPGDDRSSDPPRLERSRRILDGLEATDDGDQESSRGQSG